MRDTDRLRRPIRLAALGAGVILLLGACNGGGSHKSAATDAGKQARPTVGSTRRTSSIDA